MVIKCLFLSRHVATVQWEGSKVPFIRLSILYFEVSQRGLGDCKLKSVYLKFVKKLSYS